MPNKEPFAKITDVTVGTRLTNANGETHTVQGDEGGLFISDSSGKRYLTDLAKGDEYHGLTKGS